MLKKIVKILTLLLLLISALVPVICSAQKLSSSEENKNQQTFSRNNDVTASLEIQTHSGTPPVLEFVLHDPEKIVKKVSFDFEKNAKIDLEILRENQDSEVVFRGVPYRSRGFYFLTAFLHTDTRIIQNSFKIGFTDFEWGKDNFSFANDGKFENGIDFVSRTVLQWARERFGEMNRDQEVLLLYLMYNLYKGSIGRCYGFSGGEIRYMLYPEDIPHPYWNTYSIIEMDPRVIRDMDYIQNDIVFSNFLSSGIDISSPQSPRELEKQIEQMKKSIDEGKPIIMGYLSPEMHHSMVVYGYVENINDNSVTLITANNWEREQNNNIFSEDAENIEVKPYQQEHRISWFDLTKEKYRYPEMIFAVPFKKEYYLDEEKFFTVLNNIKTDLVEKRKSVIMVEKVEEAYLMDEEGRKGGYQKPELLEELEEISFEKIDYNYVFEFPSEKEYTLVLRRKRYNSELKKDKEVNLFLIVPGNDSLYTEMNWNLEMDRYLAKKFRVNHRGISILN